MLGKLIKHEFKATWKIFTIIYLALIVMSLLILAFSEPLTVEWLYSSIVGTLISGLFIFIYAILNIGVVAVTVVVIIQRFYTNLLGDQGYLMFTLPAKISSQIMSKYIVSMVWLIASLSIVVLNLIIAFARQINFSEAAELFRLLWNALDKPALILTLFAFVVLFSISLSIFQFYSAMSLGPHVTKNRILGSIISYVGIYAVVQIIASISIGMIFFLASRQEIYFEYYNNAVHYTYSFILLLVYILVFETITTILLYILTHYMLKNKLSLS